MPGNARPRILFAWEMGANYGHAHKLARVAEQLSAQADIYIAARDPKAVRQMAPDLACHLLPAPFAPDRILAQGESAGVCYPGVLRSVGWDDADTLSALVEAWETLIALVAPDILVVQAAPTALLAARRRVGMKTAVLGSGYDNPPRVVPMPAFEPDKEQVVALAAKQEAQALRVANAVLVRRGHVEVAHFADLIRTDASLLVTWPQTDHYAPRKDTPKTPYLGQLLTEDVGQKMEWRNTGQPRIFAYLRPGSVMAAAGMSGLYRAAPEHEIILAAPGILDKDAQKLRSREVQVVAGPVRLDGLMETCDLGLSHASNGVAAVFLTHGIPQIGLPMQTEQVLFARTLGANGGGLSLVGTYGGSEVLELIQRVLREAILNDRVKEIMGEFNKNFPKNPAVMAASEILTLFSP